jgi:RNA polymerase sigma-70 factor (ECF subfamily)
MNAAASVANVRSVPPAAGEAMARAPLDGESRQWLEQLGSEGPEHDEALATLHELLLRAARFEVARRRPTLPPLRGNDLDDIALEAADDALMSVLARLDDFRGLSRFTTWAYKFALLEAAVKLRKRAWQGRELPLEPESWSLFSSAGLEPAAEVEQGELLATVQTAINQVLTPHHRRVLVALALNGVPIDVLAERLNTTRGALYKTCTMHAASCASTWRRAGFPSSCRRRQPDGATRSQAGVRADPRTSRARSRLRRVLRRARPIRRARAGG